MQQNVATLDIRDTPPRPLRKDTAAKGGMVIAPLSLDKITEASAFSPGTTHQPRPHQHIQAQDASSAIQQLLGVEEVEMLNRIFLMEGLVPVMTSTGGSGGGGGGGGSRAPSPTSGLGMGATSMNSGMTSSSALGSVEPTAAAQQQPTTTTTAASSNSTAIDAAAAGTLCLTVHRFIEALVFVATFRRRFQRPASTANSTRRRPQQQQQQFLGSPASPQLHLKSDQPLHLSTLLQQDAHSASMMIAHTSSSNHGATATSSSAAVSAAGPINIVANALCADTPASRALLLEVVTTWTMQIAVQVEGVRVRRDDYQRAATAASVIPQPPPLSARVPPSSGTAVTTLFSPPSSAGGGSRPATSGTAIKPFDELEAANISTLVQETDLAMLFPPSRSPPPPAALTASSGGHRAAQHSQSPRRVAPLGTPGVGQSGPSSTLAGFGEGPLKLVVKWSDFTSSFIRDAEQKDSIEDQASDLQRLAKNIVRCQTQHLHLCSPTVAVVTTTGGDGGGGGGDKRKLITGGPDGLVKVWSAATNAYERTISNSGNAWVVGLALLQPHENFLVIATSNGQLTVVEFPGGAVVQKYIGCVSMVSAVAEVNVLSVLHTKKYGMSPGESGPRQVRFSNVSELSQEAFTEKRRLARGGPLNKSVAVKPIVGGFVNPTTMEYLPDRGLCFFGTVDGKVGCFDISEDLRQTTLITGSSVRAIQVSFSCAAHLDAVTCIRYASRPAMLLTAGMDGCIYKISLEGAGMKWVAHASPQRHNTQESISRPVVGMEWSEPLQLLISYTSDRVIKFWSLMRSEPLHVMEALPYDIRSIMFLGTDRLGVLTLDKTIYVYDLRTFRLLQMMVQSVTGENSGTALDASSATIIRSGGDAGGCLQYHPDREALICCLRSPVQYAPAALVLAAGSNPSSSSKLSPRSASKKAKQQQLQQQQNDAASSGEAQATPAGISPRHAVLPKHPQRVLALAFQRHTQTLYSMDGEHLFVWNMTSGECNAWSQVARQVRKASCPTSLVGKQLQMTACSWAGAEAVRLVTGTQLGAILTWSPSGTSILAVDAFPASSNSSASDVSCCATCGSHVLVAVGNKAHLITYDTSMVTADGNRRSTVKTLTLESPASIMSVCFLRETALVAIGTVDAVLHLCNLDTMKVLETQKLKDREGRDEVASVENIILLQRRKQNVALLLLEDGAVNVYHIGKRAVVFHARLFRKHEARFHAACVASHEERLYVGDSLGRMFVYDIGSITSTTDFRVTSSSLHNPCIKYLYHTQATLDGLTSMVSVDVGPIPSLASNLSCIGNATSGAMLGSSTALFPHNAGPSALPTTPLQAIPATMSYYGQPHNTSMYHTGQHHNSGTSMTLGVSGMGGPGLNSSVSTPSLAYSLLPPVPATVDAVVVGCGDGHIRCFAVSHTEAVHVGTLGDPVYGRWDWADPSSYAAEVLPRMEKDIVDVASEAFLDDILREATKKQSAGDVLCAPFSNLPPHEQQQSRGDGETNTIVGNDITLLLDGGGGGGSVVGAEVKRPSTVPTGSGVAHQLSPQRGRASVTRLPAVATAGIVAKSVSPRRPLQQPIGAAAATVPSSTPPATPQHDGAGGVSSLQPLAFTKSSSVHHHQVAAPSSQQQLHVRKRFIKPADIDLGNGRFITDHATEQKMIQLEQEHHDNHRFAQQILNANSNNHSHLNRSHDHSTGLAILPPSSYDATAVGHGGGAPAVTIVGVATSTPGSVSIGASPFQLMSNNDNNFFITSLGMSMEHHEGMSHAGEANMRGVVVATSSTRPPASQHHRRSIDSSVSVDGQSTQVGTPVSPAVPAQRPGGVRQQQKHGLTVVNSAQSSRSLATERTLVANHTVQLFDASVGETALVATTSDPQIEGVASSGSLTTTTNSATGAGKDEIAVPLTATFSGDDDAHPLPPPPRTVSGQQHHRRTSNARRRSNADSTLSLMYRASSAITIDMPSTPLPPPPIVMSLQAGQSDEETARHHTRALLQQMAYRLDRVRPRGSQAGRFGRRVDRLYETPDEKKARKTRLKEQRQTLTLQGDGHASPHILSSDDDVVSGGELLLEEGGGGVSMPLVLPSSPQHPGNGLSPFGVAGNSSSNANELLGPDDDEDDDDDDILASLRSPQTAKNILAVEEKLRLYKKARETGPALAVSTPTTNNNNAGGVVGGQVASVGAKKPSGTVGGYSRGDPAWLTRVSSQLVMQDVSFTIPSTQVLAMGSQTSASNLRGGGAFAGIPALSAFPVPLPGGDRSASLHRGISMFGFQPPAPPHSAPGTARRRSTVAIPPASAHQVALATPPVKTAR